jgi:hypothetical protein
MACCPYQQQPLPTPPSLAAVSHNLLKRRGGSMKLLAVCMLTTLLLLLLLDVVQVMGKSKVLVKVHPEGKYVVDIDKDIDIAELAPGESTHSSWGHCSSIPCACLAAFPHAAGWTVAGCKQQQHRMEKQQ